MVAFTAAPCVPYDAFHTLRLEEWMDRVGMGFIVAALYNSLILLSSQGLSDSLGRVDPLFGPEGCVLILLWGAAYASVAWHYRSVPLLVLVFCFEKGFYGLHWLRWRTTHAEELAALRVSDPAVATFFYTYGIGDLLFMAFFGWVAWRWRHNVRAPTLSE